MPVDPKEAFKDVPGLVGLVIRGEISQKCDTCDQQGISCSLLPMDDPLKLAIIRRVHKQMGCPDWQPDSGRKISSIFHCRECVVKYKEELAKLYSEITICDLCGLHEGVLYENFAWINSDFYIPETLNEIFKRCGRTSVFVSNAATAILSVPTLVFCPGCWKKITDIHVVIIKENPEH